MRTKICNECGAECLFTQNKCEKCGADLSNEANYVIGEITEEEYKRQEQAAKQAVYQNVKIDKKTPHVKGDQRLLLISKIIVIGIFIFCLLWYGYFLFNH